MNRILPASPSIQILQDGSVTPIAHTETGLPSISGLASLLATLEYTPSGNGDGIGTLTGTIHTPSTFSVSTMVDWSPYSNTVYYGFTAGSGLADDGHQVFTTMAIPEPETYAMLLAGLGLVGWAAKRRKS